MKQNRTKCNYYWKLSRILIEVTQTITDHEVMLNLLSHLGYNRVRRIQHIIHHQGIKKRACLFYSLIIFTTLFSRLKT